VKEAATDARSASSRYQGTRRGQPLAVGAIAPASPGASSETSITAHASRYGLISLWRTKARQLGAGPETSTGRRIWHRGERAVSNGLWKRATLSRAPPMCRSSGDGNSPALEQRLGETFTSDTSAQSLVSGSQTPKHA